MLSNPFDSFSYSLPRLASNARLGALVPCLLVGFTQLTLADAPVANLDSGLQKLVAHGKTTASVAAGTTAKLSPAASGRPNPIHAPTLARFDASGRVLVHVLLDGTATLPEVSAGISNLKGSVLAANTTYRHGILAAWLPLDAITSVAKLTGVRALTMEHSPQTRVGKFTSQGAAVLGTNLVNRAGLNGYGITVGVLSDSFNTAYENTANPPATTAAQDVASGDLPVVNVLQDSPAGTDEGRAMCQVVYDEVPHAKLAFATGNESEVGFANNIVALRTQAGANVIVDDIGYFDEPVFSDGLLSLAVDAVATSKTLPGKPVVYLSAAGNDGNNGYRSAYRSLADADVRKAGHHGNLKLDVTDPNSPNYLDPSLTAGGWFNWNPNGGIEPATTVGAPGPTYYPYAIFLQWDDLFDQDHGITTSYNFLVFDQDGNYLPELSSTTNAFSVQQPLQAIGYLSLGTNYQIAITALKTKDPQAGPIPAAHQIALYTTLDGASTLQGEYFQPAPLSVPGIYGHPSATGAIAVAAYDYSWRAALPYAPELENFTSPGPAAIYFDSNSHRLAAPEVRLKPEVAGVDGVVNTFFGAPYYNSPYAFFGTSAAAPSVAGVAALVLQAAGGPGSLDPAVVKSVLEGSTQPRNSTVETSQAFGAGRAGYVSVTALGQSYFPNYLTVNYFGPAGNSITELVIDGTASGLVFNSNYVVLTSATGVTAADVTVVPSTTTPSRLILKFKQGTFTSGASVGFAIGQDVAGNFTGYTQDELGVGDEAEDLAYGSTISAIFTGPGSSTLKMPFQVGFFTTDYSPADGFGLVNAVPAVESVLSVPLAQKLP